MTMVSSAAGDRGAPEVVTACGGADTGGAEERAMTGGVAPGSRASRVLVTAGMDSPSPDSCSATTFSVMAANRGSVGAVRLLLLSCRLPLVRSTPPPCDTYANTTTVSAAPAQVAWLRLPHTVALAHPLQRSAMVQLAESRA
jgi:hypothetical protein